MKDPNAGGVKIPKAVQARTEQRILKYAEAHYAGKYIRLGIRFRAQFCYIDAYKEPFGVPDSLPPGFPGSREEYIEFRRNLPTHLCRLRYFGNEEAWGCAFYTYSHEKYELTVFPNGSFYGTPEEAFELSSVYLHD
jgi:hypothetical protein